MKSKSDGDTIDERLLEIDDTKHYYTYTILESAIPFSNYRATINVKQEDDGSRVIWSATYDPESGEEATCEEIVSQVFESGLAELRRYTLAHT